MMLLIPKKTKYLKSFSSKKITKTKEKKSQNFQFSNYCIVADQAGILTSFQLESIRRFLRRYLKKSAQIFFRKFVSKTITKKPNDSRLGKGKGNVKY